MVIKSDKKEDVFSIFHLDGAVDDNEDQLNREEVSERLADSSHVFEDFHLEEIVKKRQLEMDEKQHAEEEDRLLRRNANETGELESSTRSHGLFGSNTSKPLSSKTGKQHQHQQHSPFLRKSLVSRVFRGRGSERGSLSDDDASLHYRHHSNSTHSTEEVERTNVKGKKERNPLAITGDQGGKKRHHPKKKKNNLKFDSRSGTTITATVPEEDEDYFNSDDDLDPLSAVDLENGKPNDYGDSDSDDHGDDVDGSFISNRASKKKTSDVITRSRSGMPIGGMAQVSHGVEAAGGTAYTSDYEWISPHSADTIFRDFNIEDIVKDYEKMHRKVNFGAANFGKSVNRLDDEDSDDVDENALGISVRYRNLRKFWSENFPRTDVFVFRLFIPLTFIVSLSIFLGYCLALLEISSEIKRNDEVMAIQHGLKEHPYNESLHHMTLFPQVCVENYLAQKVRENQQNGNITIGSEVISNYTTKSIVSDFSVSRMIDMSKAEFSELSSESSSDILVSIKDMKYYLDACEVAKKQVVDDFIDYTAKRFEDAAAKSLTFNWIRCWDTTMLGTQNPFTATKDHLVAAMNQPEFYRESWESNQEDLYKQRVEYLNCADSDLKCRREAHEFSVGKATGNANDMCAINLGSSAWFWFVVMTTVGYGNQSPTTSEGRALVGCLSWITIIVWAIILFVGGKVFGIVIDDLFRKFSCRVMTGDLQSVFVWGFVSASWIVVVGECYFYIYNAKLNPNDYRINVFGVQKLNINESLTHSDAYWFSYISLLTVGLGDFYLDAESFFLVDLIIWAIFFLFGFTFLSTFLGQFADLATTWFSDSGARSLKERLTNTSVVGRKEVQYKRDNEREIEKLEKLVEIMDDDNLDLVSQRVTRIRVKKSILIQLLYQTKTELEHYKNRGEQYENLSYAMVCHEENMLSDILTNTVKEREKLEAYRNGRGDSTPPLAPGESHSYFEDGTTKDQIKKKLNLRSGGKSIKKTVSPSTYL